MDNNYYVYEHIDEYGEVRYIGKGKKYRAYDKCNRNNYWKNIFKDKSPIINFIARDLSEKDAFELEKLMIKVSKDAGFKLCNFTDGGDGTSGRKCSDETIKKMSESAKNMSEETKKKISEAKKGKKQSEEHKKKLSEVRKKYKWSDETRKKMSEANINKSEKSRKEMSELRRVTTDDQVKLVLELLEKGFTNVKIANIVGIHEKTVSNIRTKKVFYAK